MNQNLGIAHRAITAVFSILRSFQARTRRVSLRSRSRLNRLTLLFTYRNFKRYDVFTAFSFVTNLSRRIIIMKHLAAYLLLGLGGNTSPSADDVKGVLSSVGIEADDERLDKLLSELEGKDLQQV